MPPRAHISLPVCSCQDIVTRHLTEKSAAEDQLPPLGPVVWAAGSQSELTPSESLATSDAVRDTLLLHSVGFSHIYNPVCSPPSYFVCQSVVKSFCYSLLLSSAHSFFFFFYITFTCFLLLHFNTSFISFSLRLVCFHPSLPCVFSSSPCLSFILLILIFPPTVLIVFELNLTARLQKPVCKKNSPLFCQIRSVLCSGRRSPELY